MEPASVRSYQIGFALSILCTLGAFGIVWEHLRTGHEFPSHEVIYVVLLVLAVAQLFVQLIYFLHMGREERPRWNLTALALAAIIVLILVGGTLWIMTHLNHHHMELNQIYQDGIVSPQTQNE